MFRNNIQRFLDAWFYELRSIFTDEGALLFCVVLPLAYPLIYSWIYNNEVVREVPVAIVDKSHSALSRKFIQKVDASPDVSVALYCNSVKEAKDAVGHGDAYGILLFPSDFATKSGRMEQAHVSVYCDMSYMLTYKAIFQTCSNVSQLLGTEIKTAMSGNFTSREEEISSRPLDFDEVPIFNVTGGYGNFVLPAVLVLIIQQAMLLAAGLLAGTDRERGWKSINGVVAPIFGKSFAYFTVFFPLLAYITLIVPRIFGFVSMVQFEGWIRLMVPYTLACTLFSLVITSMVRYRENVMLLVVFTSLPMLFLSGISWPQSNVPGFWAAVAALFPSTFGIRGFVKMSSMGAISSDIESEILSLWIQVALFGMICVYVMYRRYNNLKYK